MPFRAGVTFLLIASVSLGQQNPGQDDKILERGDKLLDEAKTAYEDARVKNSVAVFIDAGFKLEEARIKFIVLQEIGSPDKQKIATDRLRAINQLSKLIHDGKVAINGTPAEATVPKPTDSPVTPPPPSDPAKPEPKPAKPSVDVTARLPVPEGGKQKDAEKLVKELFKDQYAKKGPSDRQALSRLLLEQASKTSDDPASLWVLYREAQDVAVQICDVKAVSMAIEAAARIFDVDAMSLKTSAYSAAAKSAKAPGDFASLATSLLRLADDLIAADQYDSADKAILAAQQHSRKANDAGLVARATSRGKEVSEAKAKYQAMKSALETLAKNPEDPVSNNEMGQFLCFVKGNWDLGVRFLVKGSDVTLKAIAQKELALPLQGPDLAAIGDAWWDVSEKEKSPLRKHQILLHTKAFYEDALVEATGLIRTKLEKRLESLDQATSGSGSAPVDLLKLINVKKDSIRGSWKVEDGVLVSPPDFRALLHIPYEPPDEFDLAIKAELNGTPSGLYVGLVGGGRSFGVEIDGYTLGEARTRLYLINGQNQGVPGADYTGRLFSKGKTSDILCSVRKSKVQISVDGKKVIDWTADYSKASAFQDWVTQYEKALALGSYSGSIYSIKEMVLTPIAGRGKRLR